MDEHGCGRQSVHQMVALDLSLSEESQLSDQHASQLDSGARIDYQVG